MRPLLPLWFAGWLIAAGIAWPMGGLGWWALIPLLGTAALTTTASLRPEWRLYGSVSSGGDPATGAVALTFDDGPDPEHTLAIADTLEAHGARGTFFVVGEQVERHPEVLAALVARGHQIGHHSFDHRWWRMLRHADATADLERGHRSIEASCGRRPAWYRPPVGLVTPELLDAARASGCEVAGWTVRPRDGIDIDPDGVARRVLTAVRPGGVVLLHDRRRIDGGLPPARVALPTILEGLQRRGLRAVTLAELLGRPAWIEGPAPKVRRNRLPALAGAQTVACLASLVQGLV